MNLFPLNLYCNTERALYAAMLPVLVLIANISYGQGVMGATIPGDFADPSIISHNGTYYAVATSSEWAPHFPIYHSTDLKTWSMDGYVFEKAPDWTSGSFWAPEYFYHNNTYYIYYTARRKSDNVSCVGVATSQYPDKGFQDRGIVVAHGKEAIDGFVYEDNGQLYISFKAYGLDDRPIEILGSKLTSDGLKMTGEIFSLLKDDEHIGMEGQCIVKRNNMYFLFYSTGSCCGSACSYDVRVARAGNFHGPYEKNPQGSVLTAGQGWKCAGHGTLIEANDGQQYYLHHAYNNVSNVFTGRQGMLARVNWPASTDWPLLTPVDAGPYAPTDVKEDFKGNQIGRFWQVDFRNSTPRLNQSGGRLSLSGVFKPDNETGIVATVRPESESFEMEVSVANHNDALKGLAFYGDAGASMGIGVSGNRVELWTVEKGRRTVVKTASISGALPMKLKLVVGPDHKSKGFYWDHSSWINIMPDSAVSVEYLPQWDRSPRPGLHFKGPADSEAWFDDFGIRYKQ